MKKRLIDIPSTKFSKWLPTLYVVYRTILICLVSPNNLRHWITYLLSLRFSKYNTGGATLTPRKSIFPALKMYVTRSIRTEWCNHNFCGCYDSLHSFNNVQNITQSGNYLLLDYFNAKTLKNNLQALGN